MESIPGVECKKCGWSDFFRTETCPKCSSLVSRVFLPGRGHVVTFTIIRYAPLGFEHQAPYAVAIIRLDNGPNVIGRVKADAADMHLGLPVRFIREVAGALEFGLT